MKMMYWHANYNSHTSTSLPYPENNVQLLK